MIIKIEVDVQPEELRRFLGINEILTLPEDVVRSLRSKLVAGVENFDAAGVVDAVKGSRPWKRLMTLADNLIAEGEDSDDGESEAKGRRRSRRRKSR